MSSRQSRTSIHDNSPIYCAEQIRVPPELPELLKSFTKYIIRTQPVNIVAASAEYFQRLAKQRGSQGDVRGAESARSSSTGAETLGKIHLEAFYNKLAADGSPVVASRDVEAAARQANIASATVREIMLVGEWTETVPWIQFWALLACSLRTTLDAAVYVAAEVLADEGRVPTRPVVEVLQFLGQRDQEVGAAQADVAAEQIVAVGDEIELGQLRDILERLVVPAACAAEAPADGDEGEAPQRDEEYEQETAEEQPLEDDA
ncbi:hypothetical protein SeLEV6574_g01931 [Synchytrium endobioticum]|nr:hypothetical protein SeLEV6574_g01931 [Synchytrium endobioticum]